MLLESLNIPLSDQGGSYNSPNICFSRILLLLLKLNEIFVLFSIV